MPDGQLLVTERQGNLRLVTTAGAVTTISGTPNVASAGQGGLLDVALDPDFTTNRAVYLSYSESDGTGVGLAVARGILNASGTALTGL